MVSMNFSACQRLSSKDPDNNSLISTGIVVGVSVVLWLIAVVLILALKLHTKLVYRLQLYQILSIFLLMFVFEVYLTKSRIGCTFYLCEFTLEIVLFFTLGAYLFLITWIVLHLFALAVCHKNLKKLEPLYVWSSVLIPFVLATVSFALLIVGTFRAWNYEVLTHLLHTSFTIEGIIGGLLIVMNCVTVIIIGLILCHRAYRRRNGYRSPSEQQHKKALCQMLPLLMYPLFSATIPIVIYALVCFDPNDSRTPYLRPILLVSWTVVCALCVLCHMSVVIYMR